MTYEQGLVLFKSGNYQAAAEQFAGVTEKDERNDKAWNALGICLSKVGQVDQAAQCFENALAISPDNATYRKNYNGNEAKRAPSSDLELDDGPAPVVTGRKQAPVQTARPMWQVAAAVVGVFIILLFMGSCVASLGGHSSSSSSPAAAPQQAALPVLTAAPTDNLNGFKVTDVQFQKEQYATYVVGTVINTKNKKLSYLQVEINLYDQSGAQVGSALANINNLEPGGTWKFKAYVFQQEATDFKIKEITGW